MHPSSTPPVIWISGFSGAGKTTVGQIASDLLRHRGVDVIFLDGDDLRRVFSRRWGYERSDRVELAHVYFRLSNYLAAQGYIVVIAAIAMYDEVREWIRENLTTVFEVYLEVPEEERIRRDAHTKRVYPTVKSTNVLYDLPGDPDLTVPNFGGTSARDAAMRIVDTYLLSHETYRDATDRRSYWDQFYAQGFADRRPSPFALQVAAPQLGERERILEIGCGNGRDAFFFSSLGHEVVAIDPSVAAIEGCLAMESPDGLRFFAGKFPGVAKEISGHFDLVYSRFTLHAMTEEDQGETLRGAEEHLRPGGRLLIECRSINDPLARKGEVISPTERIHGHYRRFIVMETLLDELQDLGLSIDSAVESDGLAPYKDEDPVVIRVVASKER